MRFSDSFERLVKKGSLVTRASVFECNTQPCFNCVLEPILFRMARAIGAKFGQKSEKKATKGLANWPNPLICQKLAKGVEPFALQACQASAGYWDNKGMCVGFVCIVVAINGPSP